MKKKFELPCSDPQFLTHVFLHLFESGQTHPLAKLFDLPFEAEQSFFFDLSSLQEALRFRALHRARILSQALLDEKGEVKKKFLQELIYLLEREGHLFYPSGTSDGILYEHLLRFLRLLNQEDLLRSLRRFQKPLCHPAAEKLIFETLGMTPSGSISDTQIKAAVLCACMTPLWQNVGSCFATAPAILIQSEQIPLFLDDLYQLLTTGKLKRTFGGIEYAIPLSPSTGIGELKKNLILNDLQYKPEYNPGLIAALTTAGAINAGDPFEKKAQAAQELIREYAKGKNLLTVEELIHLVLLQKFNLSPSDLEKGKSLEIAQFKSAKMIAPDPSISQRLNQISVFHQKEKECRAAFKRVCDNALLRAWEFTLASFSEVKMEFSRWNLYSSLGLAPEEPGGIGEIIYRRIDEKITEINKKLEEAHRDYEIAFDQLRTVETLLRNADSESNARRLQAEYQSKAYHMRACLEKRDALYEKGSNYSNLLSFLTKEYDQKFPEYFQEIYDAEMQDFVGDLYDDSPAGFRLVYKHGRADPALWTLIYTAEEYIQALLDFFSTTESQIAAACEWEGGASDILEINSAIIAHIHTQHFLETALQRMAKAHLSPVLKAPLAHMHIAPKKPWAYTSGGTMTTLLKTYYCKEGELTKEEKWVENESELLIFLLDTLKNLPPSHTNAFLKSKTKGMLMHSPTHAFILLPGDEKMKSGWQEDLFTYTWVRDEIFLPNQQFYAHLLFNPAQQEFLLSKFSEQLPPLLSHSLHRAYLPQEKKISVIQWRTHLLDFLILHTKFTHTEQKQTLANTLDNFLYQNLPLIEGRDWKAIVRRILSDLMNEKVEKILQLFPDEPAPFFTAREIREAAMGCYLLAEETLFLSFDLHDYVARHARFVGVSQPCPLLFANTNWAGNYFGFVVNPGTGNLELWRLDKILSRGTPMSAWKQWLNGSDKQAWALFTRPSEYEMSPPSFGQLSLLTK